MTERHERAGEAVLGGLGDPVVAGWSGERTSVMHRAFSCTGSP
jgi:hypothetical protein